VSQELRTAQPPRQADAFCFRVKEERQAWNVLLPVPSKYSVDIGKLVASAPEFLGMDAPGPVVRLCVPVAGGEAAGCQVMVAVDESGGVMVVGSPLKAERPALTSLVREILVLHGRLWRMGFVEFASLIASGTDRPLLEAMAEECGAGLDEAVLRAGLEQTLGKGHFPVVILLNSLDREAEEAVSYLKSLGLNLKAFGVELYESWGVEVALPRLLSVGEPAREAGPGRTVPRPTPPPPRQPPPRFQTASPAVAAFGKPEPQSAPEPRRESEPVQWKPTPSPQRPWATQQVSQSPKPEPRPEPKPVETARAPAAPPPESPPERMIWDGTKPGVMAGKRPGPKPDFPEPGDARKPGKK
jgi:hypothetical protein